MMAVTLILTAASVLGAGLNAMGYRSGFVVWIGSNTGWVIANACRGLWPEAALFLAYLGFSVVGFFMWSRPGAGATQEGQVNAL